MYRRIIIFLSVIIAGLLLCTRETLTLHYHSEDNDFSFTVIEGKDSSLLIFQNQDTVVYNYDLNGCYSSIDFVVLDSVKSIYLLNSSNKNKIKRVISHSYEIVIVKDCCLDAIEDKLLANMPNDSCSTNSHKIPIKGKYISVSGFSSYYGTMCERGGGTSFNYRRNGKYKNCLYPL